MAQDPNRRTWHVCLWLSPPFRVPRRRKNQVARAWDFKQYTTTRCSGGAERAAQMPPTAYHDAAHCERQVEVRVMEACGRVKRGCGHCIDCRGVPGPMIPGERLGERKTPSEPPSNRKHHNILNDTPSSAMGTPVFLYELFSFLLKLEVPHAA